MAAKDQKEHRKNEGKVYKIPAKKKLIFLTSRGITLVFMLPRLAVFSQADSFSRPVHFSTADFVAKSFYPFLVAVIFLALNLETRRIEVGRLTIDFRKVVCRIVLSLLMFFVVRSLLIFFHLSFFDVRVNERLFRFFFSISIFIEVLLIILIAHIYHLIFSRQQLLLANESLLKMNSESRYEALKNKINPHFLFNSFNVLSSLIQSDKEAAAKFLDNLSELFRQVLSGSKTELVQLRDEMHLASTYIEILKVRFGNKIRIAININPDRLTWKLPHLAVQLLLENAVKHNIVSSRKNLLIDIFTDEQGRLTVQNNLQARKEAVPSTGQGLVILNQRCQYLVNSGIIVKRSDTGFSVTVPLTQ